MRTMRERVWAAANVKLAVVTIDTDTGVPSGPAYASQTTDGRTQQLQPEEQRQEELSADADVYRRDARIRVGRVAQRRPSQRQADRRSSTKRACGPAARCEADLRPGRFGVLLLGRCRGPMFKCRTPRV